MDKKKQDTINDSVKNLAGGGTRLSNIDILKGLGIVFVVIGHMKIPYFIEKLVYGFHMPLFFIISGYLYRRPENVARYITKKSKSLLIPYFFVGTVYCFFSLLLFGKERAVKSLIGVFFQSVNNIPIESGLWFLPALFWVTVFYALVDLYVTNKSLRIGIIVLLTIVGTMWTSYFPNLPFALTPALSVIGFFSIGHWLNICGEQLIEKKVSDNKRAVLMCILFLAFASLLIEMNGIVNVRAGKYSIIPLSYLSASIFSVSLFFIVKKVIKAKLHPVEQYLRFVGRTSIVFLCTNHAAIRFGEVMLPKIGIIRSNLIFCVLVFFLAMLVMTIVALVVAYTPLKKVFSIII